MTAEGFINHSGSPRVRLANDYNDTVTTMGLREAEAFAAELAEAIEQAKSESRQLAIRIAHREAAAE